MKAVVMAGGQGTRLRPLTSNYPKPMVTIGNKPCVQHILELLKDHGIHEVVMTVGFLSQVMRNHFDDGSSMGLNIEYSVEEAPLGTAGSVKNAQSALDDTFLVISGDALTDFDLSEVIAFHKAREAMVTIALKSVENPLEFGVVIVDEDGRIERFLEKPGWGQVFSDTINTGIYVIEPEVLDHVPAGISYDFSHELFPKLFEKHKPLYGCLVEGYWQDIGNLEQYVQANRDALDGLVRVQLPGVRLRGNIWVGQDVGMDNLGNIEGPAVIGNYARIDPTAFIGPHSVLGNNVVLKAGVQVVSSIVGDNSYLADGVRVHGSVIGNSVDVRANAVIAEGAAIGDQCSVGERSFVGNNVKVYPLKTIEPDSSITSSIIWETRGASALFGRAGVRGLVNVDVTPEMAMRLAMSYGTLLRGTSWVTASRDGHPASRVLKRAIIAGLNATGISVRDLQVIPAAVNSFDLKMGNSAGGVHVRISPDNPEEVEILFVEPPGIPIDPKRERSIENYFHREDFRRAFRNEIGTIIFPPRAVESYLLTLYEFWDTDKIKNRKLRVAIDYSGSAANGVLPTLLDRLNLEVLTVTSRYEEPAAGLSDAERLAQAAANVSRLVTSMEADLGVVFDAAAERLVVLDERGERVSNEAMLLLLLRHTCDELGPGRVALPLNVTRHAEGLAKQCGMTVERTKVSPSFLLAEATAPDVVFAGTLDGGFVFPRFLAGLDAVFAFGKVLELVSSDVRPLSVLSADLPVVHIRHATVVCPWHAKGSVMRLMVEELKGASVSLIDGIKVTLDASRWVQLVPDADEPLFHLYAEADSEEGVSALLSEYELRLRAVIDERGRLAP